MCGRFTLDASAEEIAERFQLPFLPEIQPRFNIAPSQQIPVVRRESHGRALAMARWGLVPHWAKQENMGYSTINARAETVATKPTFRAAFRQRRCLIPANGFFEWRADPRGKQPFLIRLRRGELFAFAGLWERWSSDGRTVESCTVIVTEANELIRPIHQRMPVILDETHYETWLEPARFDSAKLQELLRPYPADLMEAYPVSTRVNNPRHDAPDCIVAEAVGDII